MAAGRGSSAVDLPEPQSVDQYIGQPDLNRRQQEFLPAENAVMMCREQLHQKQHDRRNVEDPQDRNVRNRREPCFFALPVPVRRKYQQRHQDSQHEQRQEPKRPHDNARRKRRIQQQDGHDREGGVPARLFF